MKIKSDDVSSYNKKHLLLSNIVCKEIRLVWAVLKDVIKKLSNIILPN